MYQPGNDSELTIIVLEAVVAAENTETTCIETPTLSEENDIAAVKDALFGAHSAGDRRLTDDSLGLENHGLPITIGRVREAEPANY